MTPEIDLLVNPARADTGVGNFFEDAFKPIRPGSALNSLKVGL